MPKINRNEPTKTFKKRRSWTFLKELNDFKINPQLTDQIKQPETIEELKPIQMGTKWEPGDPNGNQEAIKWELGTKDIGFSENGSLNLNIKLAQKDSVPISSTPVPILNLPSSHLKTPQFPFENNPKWELGIPVPISNPSSSYLQIGTRRV